MQPYKPVNLPNYSSLKHQIVNRKPQTTIPNLGLLQIPQQSQVKSTPSESLFNLKSSKRKLVTETTVFDEISYSKLDFEISEDTPSLSLMTTSPLISFRNHPKNPKNALNSNLKRQQSSEILSHRKRILCKDIAKGLERCNSSKANIVKKDITIFSKNKNSGELPKSSLIIEKRGTLSPNDNEYRSNYADLRKRIFEDDKKHQPKEIKSKEVHQAKPKKEQFNNNGLNFLTIFEESSEFNPKLMSPKTPVIVSETHTHHGSEPRTNFRIFEQTLKNLDKKANESKMSGFSKEVENELNSHNSYMNIGDYLNKNKKSEDGNLKRTFKLDIPRKNLANSESSFQFSSDKKQLRTLECSNNVIRSTEFQDLDRTNSSLANTRYEFSPNLLSKIHQNLVENKSEIKNAIHKNDSVKSPNMSQVSKNSGKPPVYCKMGNKRLITQRSKSMNEVNNVLNLSPAFNITIEDAPSEGISAPVKEEKIRDFLQKKFQNLNLKKKKKSNWTVWEGSHNPILSEYSHIPESGDISERVLRFLEKRPRSKNAFVNDLINKKCYESGKKKEMKRSDSGVLKGEVIPRDKPLSMMKKKMNAKRIQVMQKSQTERILNPITKDISRRIEINLGVNIPQKKSKGALDDIKTTRKGKENEIIFDNIKLIKEVDPITIATEDPNRTDLLVKRIKVDLFSSKMRKETTPASGARNTDISFKNFNTSYAITEGDQRPMSNYYYAREPTSQNKSHKSHHRNTSYDNSYKLRKSKQFILEGDRLLIVDSKKKMKSKSKKKQISGSSIRKRLKFVTKGLLGTNRSQELQADRSLRRKKWSSCLRLDTDMESFQTEDNLKIKKKHFNSAMTVKKNSREVTKENICDEVYIENFSIQPKKSIKKNDRLSFKPQKKHRRNFSKISFEPLKPIISKKRSVSRFGGSVLNDTSRNWGSRMESSKRKASNDGKRHLKRKRRYEIRKKKFGENWGASDPFSRLDITRMAFKPKRKPFR